LAIPKRFRTKKRHNKKIHSYYINFYLKKNPYKSFLLPDEKNENTVKVTIYALLN